MSYAQHQEAVSRALHDLLRDPQPIDDVAMVLACRDQAVKALRERLDHLAGAHEAEADRTIVTLNSVAHQPVQHLSQVVHALPLPSVPSLPPSALLPGPEAAQTTAEADRWRCVARGLLLGTAELTRADHQPWTQRPAAGWHLVGDAATTVEALLVLDDRLASDGVLPACPAASRMNRRLVAAHAAQLAQWFGTDTAADHATAGARHDLGMAGGPPITIVRQSADFATAQRTLTAVLQGHADLLRPGSDQRAGLTAARALATGQIRLAQQFAAWSDAAAEPELGEQFRARIAGWTTLHRSTTRLVEIEKRRSPLLLAQQSEMVMRLRADLKPLTVRQLHELNAATHELTVTVGQVLRQDARNLAVLRPHGIGLPRPRPIDRTEWALTTACQALTEDPQPLVSPEPPAPLHEREQLRRALERSSIGTPPPIRQMAPSVARWPNPTTPSL